MFVTETDEIWMTADFKETQLARIHRGEKVAIHVDTFGRNYQGYVGVLLRESHQFRLSDCRGSSLIRPNS